MLGNLPSEVFPFYLAPHAALITDDTSTTVTWDGTCTDDGASSYALLSNGWKPLFNGNGACQIALDYTGSCAGALAPCTTRITYGAAWIPPANHPAQFDDVAGRVFSDDVCTNIGASSFVRLSNGWQPTYKGNDACALSFRHTQCGGLYANPVLPFDCPDPGVLVDGEQYLLTCTSGNAPDAYPIFTSPDLVMDNVHAPLRGRSAVGEQGDGRRGALHDRARRDVLRVLQRQRVRHGRLRHRRRTGAIAARALHQGRRADPVDGRRVGGAGALLGRGYSRGRHVHDLPRVAP